jgi:antitoxin component of RelBE/YafQ-DinJ toxin-antitoxin module
MKAKLPVCLDKDIVEFVEDYARKRGLSRSSVINMFLKKHIELKLYMDNSDDNDRKK